MLQAMLDVFQLWILVLHQDVEASTLLLAIGGREINEVSILPLQ